MPVYINRTVVLTLLFIFLATPAAQAQNDSDDDEGKLGEIEKAVSNRKKDKDDDDDSPAAHFIIQILAESEAIGDMFVGLGGLISGVWSKKSRYHNPNFWQSRYAAYPYSSVGSGLYTSTGGFKNSINATGHYFYNSNSLRGYSVRSRFSPSPLLGVEIHVAGLKERLRSSDDYMALYDIFLNYHRVRHQHVTLWYGLGVKGLQRTNTYHGPAFNIGMEIYPGRPISLHAAANVGSLNTNAMWETLVRMNVHYNRSIFYIGYQRFSINSVLLGGVIAGVGLYF